MAEITLFKRNMDFLKQTFPEFYTMLTSPAFFQPDLGISGGSSRGNYDVTLGGVSCALHSTYDIGREMDMLFKPLTNEDNQVIVIFGLGYGHCVDYIKKKRIKYKRLVIFEPCSNILLEILKDRAVMDVLGMKELYLHLMKTPNDMAQFLLQEALESRTVKLLYHMSYMSLFKDTYDNVLRSFRNERISTESSMATMQARAADWNINQLKTVQRPDASAASLIGKFQNVPAIIASAGPSLEKHFDLLREVGDRALIVASGSTTRIMNARDINAHIAMSIDSSIIQAGFYADYHLDSILVGSYRLHPDVFKNFPNSIYRVVLSTEFLSQYYYDWLGEKPFLISDHASVSSSAVDLLILLGCNPIILVGQDLCFHENRNYAGDEADAIEEQNRQGWIADVDIYGKKVFTNGGYKAMQNDMELINIRYGEKTTMLNATEGGLNIHGINNVKFADVFDEYIRDREPDVKERLAAAASAERGDERQGASGPDTAGEQTPAGDGAVNKRVADFFGHLLEACGKTEQMIYEKESKFASLAKLVKRGMSNNRLNNEMRTIQDYNRRLDEIPFFKQVVGPSITSQLTYYRAGGKHIADASQDWEGAAAFEHKLDEFALSFVNKFKAIVLLEMVSGVSEGAGQTVNY